MGLRALLRVQLTGSYLRATADTFPEVHERLQLAVDTLDVSKAPELYLGNLGSINAFTAGVEHPLIMVSSEAADLLTPDELLFVLAHELGHIKSGHVLYYQIAEFLPVIACIVGSATFGVGELLSAGLQVALLRWKRMSEFSADRAGLLACQDVNVALSAMIKLAGLPQKFFAHINTEDFIAQAREFEALDADKLNWLAKWLSSSGTTHPWTVMRAKQLLDWIDSGAYEKVLAAPQESPLHLPPGIKSFCTQCGRGLAGAEAFCPGCGTRLASPTPTPTPSAKPPS